MFVVYGLLFCSLFFVRCVAFAACCLCVVCCGSFVLRCLMFVVRRLFFGVCCLSVVDGWWLVVGRCSLFVGC